MSDDAKRHIFHTGGFVWDAGEVTIDDGRGVAYWRAVMDDARARVIGGRHRRGGVAPQSTDNRDDG
jgi:hypothetical protein